MYVAMAYMPVDYLDSCAVFCYSLGLSSLPTLTQAFFVRTAYETAPFVGNMIPDKAIRLHPTC